MSILKSDSRVIIYGAGKIGRRIYDLCQDRDIEVLRIWDNHPEKVVAFHKKELISKPYDFSGTQNAIDYGLEGAIVLTTAFSHNMSKLMADPLIDKGFEAVIHDRSQISSLLIEHCRWLSGNNDYEINMQNCFICPARRDENIECDVFNSSLGIENSESPDFVSFPVLGFLVTTKCNLTCVGCNHLRDHFDKSHNVNFDADKLMSDLRKLVGAVDFVKSIVIVGGEALMHPDFERMLEEIITLPKIGFVQIITNGTVPPRSESIYKLMSHPRVIVEVSGYGDEPGSPRVKKRDKFFQKLSEYDVANRYDEATQWVDFGDFQDRGLTDEEWESSYKACCFVSNDLFNGQLHKCSRSAYGLFLNKIPEFEGDFVDVRAASQADLRAEIKKYLRTTPEVCKRCNGTTTKTIPAGVQVVKLPRKASQGVA